METDQSLPRRRPDGSIDTDHYVARGRRMRAETARDLARTVAGAPHPLPPRTRRSMRWAT